jgi:hypothetical protein
VIRVSSEQDCPSRDFDTSPRVPGDPLPTCGTDGHYLCQECKWRNPEEEQRVRSLPWLSIRNMSA